MNLNYKNFTFILVVLITTACSTAKKEHEKIDRFALVNRHNVFNNEFASLNSLSVENGKFAFTADATGLQTFPEILR